MTLLSERPTRMVSSEPLPPEAAERPRPERRPGLVLRLPRAAAVVRALALAAVLLLVCLLLVEFVVGALLQGREQSDLGHRFQRQVTLAAQDRAAAVKAAERAGQQAAGAFIGGGGVQAAARPRADDLSRVAPLAGDPVALLEVPRLGISQVVVEGARPAQTERGPGHVPGTPLPGQAGNAGLVGRRTSWGAVFRHLDRLRAGDPIVVTTFQGRSTYTVGGAAPTDADDPFSYRGADQLTLVTSRPAVLASSRLTVTATLQGPPHLVTPLGGRDFADNGLSGQPGALPPLIVLLELLAVVAGLSLLAYRRWTPRIAYVVCTPVLLAVLVLTARAFDRLLPATL